MLRELDGYKVTIIGEIATGGNTITTTGGGTVEFAAGFSISGATVDDVIIVNTANEASYELGAGAAIPEGYAWSMNGSDAEFVKI